MLFFNLKKKCMLSLRYMKVLLVLWFLKSKAKRNNLCIIRKVGVKFSPIFRLHHYDQMCSRHLFCLCLWLCKIVFWKKINMSPLFSLGFFQPLCAADAHPLSVVTGLFQPYLIYWTLGFVLGFFIEELFAEGSFQPLVAAEINLLNAMHTESLS